MHEIKIAIALAPLYLIYANIVEINNIKTIASEVYKISEPVTLPST